MIKYELRYQIIGKGYITTRVFLTKELALMAAKALEESRSIRPDSWEINPILDMGRYIIH